MHAVILQAAALILCGVLWRIFTPLRLVADGMRRHLAGVVYELLMPALIWPFGAAIGLSGPTLTGVVLEAGMPSMVLGVVLCDRFGLDTGLYATALSLLTLPFWFGRLT